MGEPKEWLKVQVPKRLFDAFRGRLYDNAVAAGDAWIEGVHDLPVSDFEAAITAMLTQWLLPENERRDFLAGYRKAGAGIPMEGEETPDNVTHIREHRWIEVGSPEWHDEIMDAINGLIVRVKELEAWRDE